MNIGLFDHTSTNDKYGDLIKEILDAFEHSKYVYEEHKVTPVIYGKLEDTRDSEDIEDFRNPEDPVVPAIVSSDKVAEKLAENYLVIGHFNDEEMWQSLLSHSTPGQIRIRTSSVGREGDNYVKNDVYVLELKIGHTKIGEGWTDIVNGVLQKGRIQTIIDESAPYDIMKWFKKTCTDHISALKILCQGYLVAYGPGEPGSELSRALESMRWYDLECSNVANISSKFWEPVLRITHDVLLEETGWSELPEPVKILLDWIKDSERDVNPGIVAKAYLILSGVGLKGA